ncbi:MAG: asparagine--tRNA ligase [Bacillota bacterium]
MQVARVAELSRYEGEEVRIQGWLYNRRSSGKIAFLIVRDGSGFVQAVAVSNELDPETFKLCISIPQESSVVVDGRVRQDARAAGGYELLLTGIQLVSAAEEYPITLKEHGVDFLLDHRHLWIRGPRQHAALMVRHEVIAAAEGWLRSNGFIKVDAPILTPAACEGTSTLFETDYFGEKAYLSQSGQLYAEAAAMAFGRVYVFGPTFRAEKSKTRRHLIEFWMIEPEMAYADQEENMAVQEEFVSHIVRTCLENRRVELTLLGRDLSKLEAVKPPFPRITYDEAVEMLREQGFEFTWGDDFGAPHEVAICSGFDRPVFVTEYPTEAKAFYMQPKEGRPEVVKCADLLAPEGYGEIIGGSERIHDLALLEQRMEEHKLPRDSYAWYLDLRRYGSVPHSGFGLGIERTVAWITGSEHIREMIPFPRLLNRIYP